MAIYKYIERGSPVAQKRPGKSFKASGKKPPLGQGGRFKALKSVLGKKKGIKNPGALAAYIGRKKLGKQRFQKLAARGRKRD